MFDSLIWHQFHFMRPWWLLTFIPFTSLIFQRWRHDAQNEQWQKLLPAHLLAALTVGDNGWKKQLPLKILTIVIAVSIIICAGPTWQRQSSPFGEDKSPVMVVMDVSQSMLQTDIAPSRLNRTKQKVEDLLTMRDGGRTGLIVYAGSAHLAMPLTQDIDIYKPLLNAVTPKIMPRDGKFAEYALPLIEQQFASNQRDNTQPADAANPDTSKKNTPEQVTQDPPVSIAGTVVLFTDGMGANTVEAFQQYFKDSPHQLLVVAVGSSDKPSDIPLDINGLQTLTEASNGKLEMLTVDNQDMEWVNNQINRHMQLSLDSALPWQDMGYYLVFVVALLFLLWFRSGWLVQWCMAGMLVLGALSPNTAEANDWHFADIWMTADQQGQWYFNQEDYVTAAERFADPMWKGVALYSAGEYKAAHAYFMRVDSDQALFNAANALAHSREYVAARNLYDALLVHNDAFPNAQHNRDVLQGIIDNINMQSESQANTENEASRELGDAPQTADGADEQVAKELVLEEALTAEQLLQDEALNARWMQRVQADPARFLSTKFNLQLNQTNQLNQAKEAE
jgi:Ca-activated chloride channel homolog